MKEVRAHNVTIPSDYRWPFGGIKFLLLLWLLSLITLYFTFPFKKIADHILASTLHSSPKCNLSYKDYHFSFFLPKLVFEQVTVPSGCMGPEQKAVPFEKLSLGFGGVNFSPLGVVASVGLDFGKNKITPKISSNGKKHSIKIQEDKVDLPSLMELVKNFTGTELKLEGVANLDLTAEIQKERLKAYNIKLQSKNLYFPAQSISGFPLPDMDLQVLDLKSQGKDSKMLIETLNLGTEDGPLLLNADGEIFSNMTNFSKSKLKIDLDLKLGEEITSAISILEMALAQYKKGDRYALSLKGTVGAPMPSAR